MSSQHKTATICFAIGVIIVLVIICYLQHKRNEELTASLLGAVQPINNFNVGNVTATKVTIGSNNTIA